MKMRETIEAHLQADGPLMALLVGGLSIADDFGLDQGAGKSVPRDVNGFVLTFALLRFKEAVSRGPISINAKGQNLEVYVFQDYGYDQVQLVFTELYRLLHNQYFTVDDRSLVHLWNTYEGMETTFEEFGDIPGQMMRFNVIQTR